MRLKNILLLFAIGYSLIITSQTTFAPDKPTLVIQIVVDQMRQEYIDRFWNNFSDNGFKQLVKSGLVFKQVRYPYQSTQSAADYATLSTGALPAQHGIIGYNWYDAKSKSMVLAVEDKKMGTIGPDAPANSFSASKLLASTVADELAKSNQGRSKVFSIATRHEAATLLAGHKANGVFWISPVTGKWNSSQYYTQKLPDWLNDINTKHIAETYRASKWGASLLEDSYVNNWMHLALMPEHFPIDFEKVKYYDMPYRALQSTPFTNTLTKECALALIEKEELGKDKFPDLLYIAFNGLNSSKLQKGPYSMMVEDFYIKLDHEIAEILKFAEEKVGRENIMVVLSSTQAAADLPEESLPLNIPGGIFKQERAFALLNSYLMALYGQGDWILNYNNLQIYLNRDLIEKSNFDYDKVSETASRFLEEYTGIAFAYPAKSVIATSATISGVDKIGGIICPGRTGDIILSLQPGWVEPIDDMVNPGVPCSERIAVPLIYYGWKISYDKEIAAESPLNIAVTIANVLGINRPNTAAGVVTKITKIAY